MKSITDDLDLCIKRVNEFSNNLSQFSISHDIINSSSNNSNNTDFGKGISNLIKKYESMSIIDGLLDTTDARLRILQDEINMARTKYNVICKHKAKVQSEFSIQLNKMERNWIQWDCQSLLAWFKYIVIEANNNNNINGIRIGTTINWQNVLNNLTKENWNGVIYLFVQKNN